MNKKSVLIVEDKDYLSNIIEEYLSSAFQCKCVGSAREALAAPKPDAAVISLNIKDQTGEGLMKELKSKYGIPVVILTNNSTSLMRIRLLKNGADDIMSKPFNPEELLLRVQRLVK